jgi:hypothetical protein
MPRLSNEGHETFARVFVETRHFGKAAEAAGSTADNLSQAGAELYSRPEVKARVTELSDKMLKPINMNATRLMTELGRMATIDYAGFYHEDGSQKMPHELTADQSACVKGTDRNGRYQFWDKATPVTLLAKHFKIVGDEGDGVSALASALADRLNTAKRRDTMAPVRVVDSSAIEIDDERMD